MVVERVNVLNHCGWGSDFAIVGCDKPKATQIRIASARTRAFLRA